MHIVITGARGYIGARLVAAALRYGWTLTLLGRGPGDLADPSRLRQVDWRLGEEPPARAFAVDYMFPAVDAVIHLAHDWRVVGAGQDDTNFEGTRRLLDCCRQHGVRRFVFASTLSARPDALNRYGRNKAAIEALLVAPEEVAARIGLVYGGPRRGMYGVLSRLVRIAPVLPMVDAGQLVQPIHIDDLCAALISLVERPALARTIYGLADATPIPFGQFVKSLARHAQGWRLRLVPVPRRLVLLLADLSAMIPGLPTVDRERVLGLAGIRVRDTTLDVADLGIVIRDMEDAFVSTSLRRRLIREAITLLTYCLGQAPRRSTIKLYVRSLEQLGVDKPARFPPILAWFPRLLRLIDPMGTTSCGPETDRLRERLMIGLRVAEASGESASIFFVVTPRSRLVTFARLSGTITAEALLWPMRHFVAGRKR